MRAGYDAKTDTLAILLKQRAVVEERREVKPGIRLDFDRKGDLVSLEIRPAKGRVTGLRTVTTGKLWYKPVTSGPWEGDKAMLGELPKFASEAEEADWWYANRDEVQRDFASAWRWGLVSSGAASRLGGLGKRKGKRGH